MAYSQVRGHCHQPKTSKTRRFATLAHHPRELWYLTTLDNGVGCQVQCWPSNSDLVALTADSFGPFGPCRWHPCAFRAWPGEILKKRTPVLDSEKLGDVATNFAAAWGKKKTRARVPCVSVLSNVSQHSCACLLSCSTYGALHHKKGRQSCEDCGWVAKLLGLATALRDFKTENWTCSEHVWNFACFVIIHSKLITWHGCLKTNYHQQLSLGQTWGSMRILSKTS